MGWFKTSNVRFGYHYRIEDGTQSEPPVWISYDLAADERLGIGGTAIMTPNGLLADLPGSLTVVHATPTYDWLKNRTYAQERDVKAAFLQWAYEGVWSETDHRFDYAIGIGAHHGAREGEPGFSPPSRQAYYLTVACSEAQVHNLIDAAKSGKFPLLDVSIDLGGPAFGSEIGPEKWDYNANPLLLIYGIRFLFKTVEGESELN